ncbi:MAG: hypothetical protein JSV48_03500 [Bradyrhizobium sp.]|nr:MAG: hypothetical protein JSV48_03500 [Bradyrhizobium sp.]
MPKAFIRPRSVRIAFLVDEHQHWRPMIDAIFADCFGRWGGRFNLIVPCENGQIRPAYIPWLKAYDADVLYSYVDLSENAVERLHEQFYPSALIRHDFHNHPERDKHAFRPHIPFVPLSSLSTSLLASRGTIFNEPQPVSLLDFYGRNPPPQFLQENFGCYRESLAPWPIPANLSEYIRAVALVEKEVADNPTLVPRPPSDNVTDYQVILQRLAEQRDLSGLAQLSASMCPRLQLHDQRWANRVNIIVGDSFADRLTFWNARSHLAVYLDSSLVTLKMSKADIDDDATLAAIVAIIKNRIHVSYSGQSNSYITVRSASHNQQELDDIVARFHQVDSWNIYSSERIGSIDDCCPEQQALATAMDHVEGRGMFQVSDWHETTFSETSFRPPLIWPRHIRDASIVPDSVTAGAWALDLDIERTLDYSPFENVRHRWRLPRRLRATGAFSGTYQLAGFGSTLSFPRVTDHGLLTLFGQREGRLPEINAPVDDETVFRVALCAPRDWLPFAQGQGPYQNSLVFSIRPSDKGRYLTALTHLSGGINAARAIFLS